MKCIFCEAVILDDHDASEIHAYCWTIVHGYAQAYQHQLQHETHCIDKALFRKLEKLAHHKKMWVWNLINDYLTMAVAHDRIAQHDTAVSLLGDVLARCIRDSADRSEVPPQVRDVPGSDDSA